MKTENNKNISQLAIKIEHHPFLSTPPHLRDQSSSEAMSFRNLMFQWADIERRMQIQDEENSIMTDRHLKAMEVAKYSPSNRGKQLDGVAFMESLTRCMKSYTSDCGSNFLTYFAKVYKQHMYKEASAILNTYFYDGIGLHLSRGATDILLKVSKYLESSGSSEKKIPDSLLAEISKAVEVSETKLRSLLACIFSVRNPIRPDASCEDDDELLWTQITNPSDIVDVDPEYLNLFAFVIEAFSKQPVREYPRLFISNGIIRLLKIDSTGNETALYSSRLDMMGDNLWANVLVVPYLDFIYLDLPNPATVQSLIYCKLSLAPNNASIAQYRHVSEAAVSKQYQKYLLQMQAVRKMYQEQC